MMSYSKSTPNIAIIGAGVIGLSCASKLINQFRDVQFTLISDQFTPLTTGDGAAGLWGEYLAGENNSREKLHKWLRETYLNMEEMFHHPNAPMLGVSQLQGYRLQTVNQPACYWSDIVSGFTELSTRELKIFGDQYCWGVTYTSYVLECSKFLPRLMQEFTRSGGSISREKVQNLHELIGKYDAVINCTGLGASSLVPDPSVIPIRGQTIRVKAPWIKTFVADDSTGCHVIPNINTVLLGGTKQEGNYTLTPNSVDANNIWKHCCQLVPSLKHAKIVRHWVGLRPGRHAIRLERETLINSQNKMEVIHNYGHGGSGISLATGCANEVANHLKEYFRTTNISKL